MGSASRKHKNKKPHNWLVYKNLDKFFQKYAGSFTGIVYDLGCGEKPFEAFFLKHAKSYTGIDWSDSPHKLVADIVADLNKPLPVENDIADTVVSISVLEHLREPGTMLGEAFRILKPGGNIILQVPWQWWIHESPHDYFRYSEFGLEYLFSKAGFEKIKVEPMAGFFTTLVLKKNYFTLRILPDFKPLRALLKAILIPFWYLGQILAPVLDKLDPNWELEAPSYWVTAIKSKYEETR